MPEKPRVLVIIAGLAIGEPLGGAERFGVELARHLDPQKIDLTLCAFWHRGGSAEQHWLDHLTQSGVKVLFAANHAGGIRGIINFSDGIRTIASHFHRPIDVIHSHFQIGSLAALCLKPMLQPKALVRTAHARKEWGEGLLAFLCRQVFTKWIFPILFDAEIGVSETMVSSLNRHPSARILRRRALLVHNAISLDRFTRINQVHNQRQQLGLSASDLIVGSVGRLRREKGYTTLLESARSVKTSISNVKFLIVGDGEQRTMLQQKSEQMGLTETVIFTGALQSVESVYSTMDLFVLPSLWEGLPTVILESMACSVPVVATDIPGTRELVQGGETGWLAKPGDPDDLANCIIEALSEPNKRAAVAERALQEIVPLFSLKHVARQYEDVYYGLIANNAGDTRQNDAKD